MRIFIAIVLTACIATSASGQSREYNGEPERPRKAQAVDEIIVKWRQADPKAGSRAAAERVSKLASSTGVRLQRARPMTFDTDVLRLDRPLAERELKSVLDEIAADPSVEYAAPNGRRWAHALPGDPLITEQWYFRDEQPSATRAEHAWDLTTGSSTTIVAVIDTGARFEHPDLQRADHGGKLLNGFDFVSRALYANDGNGRDDDAADPGDWVSASEAPQLGSDCIPPGATQVNSSWHGTRVASLIGAFTDNAAGMAGTDWNTLLLPVRVLGKCGGFDDDIIAGMRWAAGLPVSGIPANPNRADIINLSLGGAGACSPAYQDAIDDITAAGVLVVASVGNEGGRVSAPANCEGVLGVTALRQAGTKVGFSNLGPGADIGAPGGNCVNPTAGMPCVFYILAATNDGLTTPGNDIYTGPTDSSISVGTSFAAPLVAGAAALMRSLNERLLPSHFTSLLQESASPFPTSSTTTTAVCNVDTLQPAECICTTQTCGAGMLNAQSAVLAAQRPFAIALAPRTITAGTDIAIDASGSFASDNRNITAYQWTALNVTGAAPAFVDASQAQTTLQVSGTSEFTLRLTVTDDQGARDTADVAVATPAPPAPPPSSPPRRSGGGGGNDALLLLGLSLIFGIRHRELGRSNPSRLQH